MSNSTARTHSTQRHSFSASTTGRYIATSGTDLVETDNSLDLIVAAAKSRCCLFREDIALWMKDGESAPWVVAVVRPAPSECASVVWM